MHFSTKTVFSILALISLASTGGIHLPNLIVSLPDNTSPTLQQDFTPPHIFPEKEWYEVEEGEGLVITLNTIFPSLSGGCIETVGYEALSPKPSFVIIGQSFRREFRKAGNDEPFTHQMALLVLSPQPGDAGKYEFQIREKLCPQSEGTILSFKVNVKRLGPPLRVR